MARQSRGREVWGAGLGLREYGEAEKVTGQGARRTSHLELHMLLIVG